MLRTPLSEQIEGIRAAILDEVLSLGCRVRPSFAGVKAPQVSLLFVRSLMQ